MKHLLKPLLFLCALGAFAAAQAASFEGKITMQMSDSKNRITTMDYFIKDQRARFESVLDAKKGTKAVSIIDTPNQQIIVLMPAEQKMYMVIKMDDVASLAKKARDNVDEGTFEKTGETETILGYKTTKYISRAKNGETTELWATDGIGAFYGWGKNSPFKGLAKGDWEKEMMEKGAFMLRMINKDKKGVEKTRVEVTAIDKQSVPDSSFVPPADYKKFDLGSMFKGAFGGK